MALLGRIGRLGRPSKWAPEWTVPHLVFQSGVPWLKRSSLTGGGFLPCRQLAGFEAPYIQPYIVPITSMTGAGFAAVNPGFTTALLGPDTMQL